MRWRKGLPAKDMQVPETSFSTKVAGLPFRDLRSDCEQFAAGYFASGNAFVARDEAQQSELDDYLYANETRSGARARNACAAVPRN